jgi:hypothetical protein
VTTVEDAIKKDVPTANIRCHTLDLSSLTSIHKTTAKVNTCSEPIHA